MSADSAPTNALTVIPDGLGEVALSPPGSRYRLNTNVVLQAAAGAGQEFLGWSGAASGSQNPLSVTMNSNKVITARFTKRPWLQGEGHPDLLSQDGFRLTLTGEFGAAYQVLRLAGLGRLAATGHGDEYLGHGAVPRSRRQDERAAVLSGVSFALNGLDTAVTNRRVIGVRTNVGFPVPAALALLAAKMIRDLDLELRCCQMHRANRYRLRSSTIVAPLDEAAGSRAKLGELC